MKLTKNWSTSLKYVLSFLLWVYIVYRAVFFSITQDEAHSYLLAKTNNWRQMAGTTNTHWLNTLAVRLLLFLPGEDAVWKLRLLSMFSWIVYSWSAIKLSDRFFKNVWSFAFFAALVLNPFVVFYFSLERGYAPAFALLLLAFYLASDRVSRNEFAPANWTVVFALSALAALANFSAFYFFMALTTFYLAVLFVTGRYRRLSLANAWPIALITGAIGSFTAVALFFVRSRNELYYGGTNLTASMIGSMLKDSNYIDPHYQRYKTDGVRVLLSMEVSTAYHYFAVSLFVISVLVFLWLGYKFFRAGSPTFPFLAVTLFIFMLLINGLLHLLFDTPYLFSRTALVVYPLMTAALFALLQQFALRFFVRTTLAVGFFVVLGYNFYKSFSLQTFVEWPVQADTASTLDFLQQKKATNAGLNLWDYSLLANYYSKAYPGRYTFPYAVLPDYRDGEAISPEVVKPFDYIVLAPPPDSLLLKTWKTEKIQPLSKTAILAAPGNQ